MKSTRRYPISSVNDYSGSICIAYPYVFPQETNLPIDYEIEPHCTLIYLGDVSEASFTMQDLRAVLDNHTFEDLGIIDVSGLALFGQDSDVLVMTLNSSHLTEYFDKVATDLLRLGIENKSSFPGYNPHITLNEDYHGPTIGFDLPTTVGLGQPYVWWGDDRG